MNFTSIALTSDLYELYQYRSQLWLMESRAVRCIFTDSQLLSSVSTRLETSEEQIVEKSTSLFSSSVRSLNVTQTLNGGACNI